MLFKDNQIFSCHNGWYKFNQLDENTLYHVFGYIYEGEVEEDLPNGRGKIYLKEYNLPKDNDDNITTKYVGFMKNGLRNGYGIQWYLDGAIY